MIMSSDAEYRAGLVTGERIKAKFVAGLESWPLTLSMKTLAEHSIKPAIAVATDLLRVITENKRSCSFADLRRDPLVFALIDKGILHKISLESGLWYLRLTPFSRSWAEFILATKGKT